MVVKEDVNILNTQLRLMGINDCKRDVTINGIKSVMIINSCNIVLLTSFNAYNHNKLTSDHWIVFYLHDAQLIKNGVVLHQIENIINVFDQGNE